MNRPSSLRWCDDHCHLPKDADKAAEAVADARAAGVERMITVGTEVWESEYYADLAGQHPGVVYATAGVHPHDAKDGIDGLEAVVASGRVVAVGECGLDFHYDKSPRDVQREVFAAQIAMALAHDVTLVIHTRDAWAETFDVLAAEGVPARTVFHCFTGGPDEARRCLDLGAHLSISGIVTFPSADDVREAVALAPLDRLLVETDSPYLAPVPHRGKPNRPALVPVVGAAIADAKAVAVDDVAAATWANAEAVYRLT